MLAALRRCAAPQLNLQPKAQNTHYYIDKYCVILADSMQKNGLTVQYTAQFVNKLLNWVTNQYEKIGGQCQNTIRF